METDSENDDDATTTPSTPTAATLTSAAAKRDRDPPVEHDLAHQHVLEGGDRLGTVDRVVALERLVEVGEGGLEVLLIGGMQDAWRRRQNSATRPHPQRRRQNSATRPHPHTINQQAADKADLAECSPRTLFIRTLPFSYFKISTLPFLGNQTRNIIKHIQGFQGPVRTQFSSLFFFFL